MRLSERGEDLIIKYEGFSARPYICPAGKLTIGHGHVILPGEEERYVRGITRAEAETLLEMDALRASSAVTRLTKVPLAQGQFDALVSFIFNLGSGAYQRSTLRQKLNRGEYEDAAGEFKKWVYSRGRKLPGLIKRRNEEKSLFMEVA